MRYPCLLALALSTCATVALAADLPQPDAVKPAEIYRTGDYSEGVVVDHEGHLYFSHGAVISKISPDGKKHEIWARLGAPNGHKILADGSHLVCDGKKHAILHLDELARELAPESTASEGKPLRAPNDLTLDPKGGFYFTDPGGSDLENPIGTVHYVNAEHETKTVAVGLAFPNGVVLRPGGKELLVGESKQNRILKFPVLEPGKLGKPDVLVNLPRKGEGQTDNQPDGMCLDADGNLYVAHYGMRQVQVISPQGEVLRRYAGGNLTTSNVCFAGPKLDQLFVTGGEPGAIFRLDLGVKGLKILPDRDGSSKAPNPVSGTVTLQGQPLKKGVITFVPDANSPGKVATGMIENGMYELTTDNEDDGAIPGTYRVTIGDSDPAVPAKFQDAEKSGLTARVGKDRNVINFDLK